MLQQLKEQVGSNVKLNILTLDEKGRFDEEVDFKELIPLIKNSHEAVRFLLSLTYR